MHSWLLFIVFVVAVLVFDRVVPLSVTVRHVFRILALMLAVLWLLVLVGVLAAMGVQ